MLGPRVVSFFAAGVPAPKGSTKAFAVRTKAGAVRAVVTDDNARTRPWAAMVKDAAKQAIRGSNILEFPRGVPVALDVTFLMPRPASLPKRVQTHTKKPDLDKLVRALKDALTGTLWQDDSQVVRVGAAKRYAGLDEPPGAAVRVMAWRRVTAPEGE